MDETEQKRGKNAKLIELCELECAQERALKHAHDTISSEDADRKIAVLCKGCSNTDASKMEECHDKSGIVCTLCGVVNATNFQSSLFERVQRYDVSKVNSVISASRSAADGLESSKERSKIRSNEVYSTRVAHKHKTAQGKLTREAAVVENTESIGLSKTHDLRKQRAMVEVHKMLKNIGRDPDTCQIFDSATRSINKVFKLAGAHMIICRCEFDTCPSQILNAAASSIACESVRHTIGSMLIEEDASSVNSVRQARTLLSSTLSRYESVSHVSDPLRVKFETLARNMASLKKPCLVPISVGFPTTNSMQSIGSIDTVVATTEDLQPTAVSSISKKVKISIESLVSLGWVDTQAALVATSFCSSAEFYQWASVLSAWSPDMLALMVAVSSIEGDKSNLERQLEKLSKTERVNIETVKENMLRSLIEDSKTKEDLWV